MTKDMSFPFKLVFKPGDAVKNMFSDDFEEKYTVQLKRIPAGTVIYEVYAVDSPDAQEVKIGALSTTSEFVTSHWGDETLCFQHNLMDDDLAAHPEWVSKTPAWSLL